MTRQLNRNKPVDPLRGVLSQGPMRLSTPVDTPRPIRVGHKPDAYPCAACQSPSPSVSVKQTETPLCQARYRSIRVGPEKST